MEYYTGKGDIYTNMYVQCSSSSFGVLEYVLVKNAIFVCLHEFMTKYLNKLLLKLKIRKSKYYVHKYLVLKFRMCINLCRYLK